MTTVRTRLLLIAAMLSTVLLGTSFADIKVGSYSWAQKGTTGGSIPAANQYGGGYNHIDISWTWTVEDGQAIVRDDWTNVADCLDANPTWYAGHSGAQYMQYVVKRYYPSLWTRIKAHSDAGRYDGSEMNWSEGYFSFGGDEYYLRNYFISTRFCMDNFGYAPSLAAGYDLDNPAWTQPKIMSYMIGRSTQNPTGLGFCNKNTGQAQGLMFPFGQGATYKWTADDGSMAIVGGGGDWSGDGGGAETCVNSAGRFPTFASKVYQENVYTTNLTNTWNDNLIAGGSGYSLFFWGAKMCENRLLEAEKFGTFARPYGYTYPFHGDSYLYDVWGNFMKFNQHDIADAQGTPWQVGVSNTTNMNLQDAYTSALKVADTSLTRALSVISSNVNTTGSGTSVIVYNALSWTRTDYVIVNTSDIGFSTPISVKDDAGTVVPSQVITDGGVTKLVFTAENVPSLGFKEFKVSNTAAAVAAGVTATGGSTITLDNQYCTVKVDKTTGAISSLYDKTNAKELLSGPGNRIASTTSSPNWWDDCCQFYSHITNNIPAALTYKTPTAVTLVDSGPAVARVKATYTENGVNWDHYITLFSKVPVATNRMVTSNLTNNNELVLNLPLNTAVSNSTKEWNAGVAYGHHKYVNKLKWTPTQKWANVSDAAKDYGVALLENNCTIWSFYGVGGANDLRLVLLAEQTSRWGGHWSKTAWEMSWGIWGHAGDWTDGAVQKGYEFNSPLIARVEAAHAGSLPTSFSFLSVDQENIVVTAVKKWESELPTRNDSLTMQVRFYEIDGKNTDASLNFPGSPTVNAWESMGNEYGVYGNKLTPTSAGGTQKVTLAGVGHNQIRSLKVQTAFAPVGSSWNAIPSMPMRGVAAGASSRVYNARGQVVFYQRVAGSNRQSVSRALPAGGIFLVQYVDKDGRSLGTRRVCSPGMSSQH